MEEKTVQTVKNAKRSFVGLVTSALPMDLPNPGTEFMSPASPELAGGFFTH